MMPGAAMMPPANPPNAPVLRDIHLPLNPAWWPPAPGWWFVAVLAVALVLVAIVLWRRWRHRVRERRQILDEVEQCRLRHQRDADAAQLAGGLHQLLRRVARMHDPAATQLQGDAWRAMLARVPVDADTLQQLLALEQAMYRAGATFDPPRALAAVRAWLGLALRPRQWKAAEATHA